MEKTLITQLNQVGDYLQNKKITEAGTELSKIEPSSLNEEEFALYCLLDSEIKLWTGDQGIEESIQTAIRYYKQSTDNIRYAKAKYIYGWFLASKGKNLDAREVLLESYLNYKRYDKESEMARVLNRLAAVQYVCGEYKGAIDNLNRCLIICNKRNEHDKTIKITRNIASVYFKCGELRNAKRSYEKIKKLALESSDIPKFNFLLSFSLISAFQGNINASKEIIGKCELKTTYKRELSIYYEYLGWTHNLAGDYSKAEKALNTGLKISKEHFPNSDHISQTKRLLADAYIGLGKYTLAQKTAEEALIVAEKINERVEIAGCYRVFALVALHYKDFENARTWFDKAVDMYKLIQSRYELAATQYAMAVSGLYDTGVKSGLLYMAREYFESEDIKHYIEKIDKAISVIKADKHSKERIGKIDPENAPVFIAKNYKTQKIVEMAEHIAQSNMTVLLTGETGAGKDQLARYIHYYSGRKDEMVPVNCAAVPDTMVESELFGYTKGAFTGADNDKLGILESADGGTVYLNEIGDATPAFQAKLLEVLETRKVRKLGTNKSRQIDVRFITATNYDLKERIHNGQFRLDLYHRINEIPIHLPPLENRKEDIPDLALHFFGLHGLNIASNDAFFMQICDILKKLRWAGNVRQLKSEIDRLNLLGEGDLSVILNHLSTSGLSEKDQLLKVLRDTDWNRSETARRLGVSEGTIRNRIAKYNL